MRKALVISAVLGTAVAGGSAAAQVATADPTVEAGLRPVAGAVPAGRIAAGSVPGGGTVITTSRGGDGWHLIVVNPDGNGFEVTLSPDGDLLQVSPHPASPDVPLA